MAHKKATMKDVANLAGVTQPTVSYVINNSANISESVKKRVYAAIEELDYKPNYYARALKTNTSNTIAIIIPDIVNQYYSRMVQMISNELNKKGYQVTIYSTSYNKNKEQSALHLISSMNIDGIIVLYQLTDTGCWELLKKSGIHAVVLDGGKACDQMGIPNIKIDSFNSTYEAVKFLLYKGRKKIAFIQRPESIDAFTERHEGYIKAMTEVGLYDESLTIPVPSSETLWEMGDTLGRQISAKKADAVITTSDIIAVGIIKYYIKIGKKIPSDLSVIGYDDIPIAGLFNPSLTTIAQPFKQISKIITDVILNRNKSLQTQTELKTTLVIREST